MAWKASETGLMVWVQDKERKPVGKCTTIIAVDDEGERTYCHTPLYSQAEMERHCTSCATKHADVIRKASLRHRMPAFYGPESGIPDLEQWFEKRDAAGESNRQKVIQGRKKM